MTTTSTCQPTGCTIWDGAPEEELETLCCLPIVETFADLRTLPTDLGYFPSRVSLRGHTTPGDGGGGEFNILTGAAPGTYVDDDIVTAVFAGGDGGAAAVRELQSGWINVRWGGAKGDYDGLSGTDDTAAIQKVINYAATHAYNVYIPAGRYLFTQLWITNDPVNNPGYPVWDASGTAQGKNLKIHGDGPITGMGMPNVPQELAGSGRTSLESVTDVPILIDGVVREASTVKTGMEFKGLTFTGNNVGHVIYTRAMPTGETFKDCTVVQFNNAGSGVLLEEYWMGSIDGLKVLGQYWDGTQTGDALVIRYEEFLGGGIWQIQNTHTKGFKRGIVLGYDTDYGGTITAGIIDTINVTNCQTFFCDEGITLAAQAHACLNGFHAESIATNEVVIGYGARQTLLQGCYLGGRSSNACILLGTDNVPEDTIRGDNWSQVVVENTYMPLIGGAGIKQQASNKIALRAWGNIFASNVDDIGIGIDMQDFYQSIDLRGNQFLRLEHNIVTGGDKGMFIPAIQFEEDENFITNDLNTTVRYIRKDVQYVSLTTPLSSGALNDDADIWIVTNDGSGTIYMANPETDSLRGRHITFVNASPTEDINILKNDTVTLIVNIPAGQTASVICTGTEWVAMVSV